MSEQTIDLSEEVAGKLVSAFDGVWVAATSHHPGGAVKTTPAINNRCIVLRLEEDGAPVLLVLNAVDVALFAEVRRVESETGLTVKHIVSPGGGHHLSMPAWHDEFTEATIHLCPVRAPRTMNCKDLVRSDRCKPMDLEAPLSQFEGQLDAVIFSGLAGFRDVKSPHEGGKENLVAMMKMMWMFVKGPNDPVDELWVHHVASGTVIAGENLGWMLTGEDFDRMPGMFKKMLQPGKVYLPTAARKVVDSKSTGQAWKKVLDWPARALMTYHDTPTFAWKDDPRAALRNAVQEVDQLG